MIQKVILNPSVTVTDPQWLTLIAYVQRNPFCKFKELDFKNGKPFLAIEEELFRDVKVEKSFKF